MKVTTVVKRDDVYNAPIIPWSNDTYTPISNKFIIDLIQDKLSDNNMIVKNDYYKAALNKDNQIRGVIGGFDIATDDGEFGQRIMFRNSYDKSMSFAFTCGGLVWICENGCVSGDYTYKRVHRGVTEGDSSTTKEDIITNINDGFSVLEDAFGNIVKQMNELKHFQIGPTDVYKLIGKLFFDDTLSINQMSVVKKELETSKNFKHLGELDFTAFDLYNHITESLKLSHPLSYIKDHADTHKLFEETFNI